MVRTTIFLTLLLTSLVVANAAEMPACGDDGSSSCQVKAKLVDESTGKLALELIQKKTKAKTIAPPHPKDSPTAAAPGWYAAGVDTSCKVGCAKVGLGCIESDMMAQNDQVNRSRKVLTLISELGGSTNATGCWGGHASAADVPGFSPDACFYSSDERPLSSYNCSARPHPLNRSKERLCYCSSIEAPTTTAGPTNGAPAPTTTTTTKLGLSGYDYIGNGQCLFSNGTMNDIGWGSCTCSDGPACPAWPPEICPSITTCVDECDAADDCSAFGWSPGYCWLYRGSPGDYVSVSDEFGFWECYVVPKSK